MAEVFLSNMLTRSLEMGSGGQVLHTGQEGLGAEASETDTDQRPGLVWQEAGR